LFALLHVFHASDGSVGVECRSNDDSSKATVDPWRLGGH